MEMKAYKDIKKYLNELKNDQFYDKPKDILENLSTTLLTFDELRELIIELESFIRDNE